jgi:hypothetical protein
MIATYRALAVCGVSVSPLVALLAQLPEKK